MLIHRQVDASVAAAIEDVRAKTQHLTSTDPALATFVNDDCIDRYLVARRGNVNKAAQALCKTLLWRQQHRPDFTTWADVRHAFVGGRLEVLQDRDLQGRPVVLNRLRCPAPEGLSSQEHLRSWVQTLECATHLADDGAGKVLVVFDMDGYSDPGTVMPDFRTRVEAVRIAQLHYPERLALAVVANAPRLFWALWKAVQPILDPVTRSKVAFVSGTSQIRAALLPHLAPAQLYQSLGGDRPDAFDFDVYDAYMTVVDEERCAAAAAGAKATAAKCVDEVVLY